MLWLTSTTMLILFTGRPASAKGLHAVYLLLSFTDYFKVFDIGATIVSTISIILDPIGFIYTRVDSKLQRCRAAYNRRDPITFRKYFQEAVDDMELQYFMILTARAKLYDWDAGSNIPDIKLTPLSSLEAWEIRWDIEEPTLTAITELEAQKMQDDIQRRIAQQIFFAQQNAAHEAGSQVPQGSEFVDGDGANGHNVNIEDDAEMEHGKHENQTLPP